MSLAAVGDNDLAFLAEANADVVWWCWFDGFTVWCAMKHDGDAVVDGQRGQIVLFVYVLVK